MPVFETASEEETIALGERIGRDLRPGGVVLLIGNLGAGKTTLAKGIACGIGAAEPDEVSSPTFTLIHEYGMSEHGGPRLYHIDLYRLNDARELAALGLDEIFDSSTPVLVEWGERFLQSMPSLRMEIYLRPLDGDRREIEIREVP